jgi:hypothetical protein
MFIYGVPGYIGGAATKVNDLAELLINNGIPVKFVLPEISWTRNEQVKSIARKRNIPLLTIANVDKNGGDVVVAICELGFFLSGAAAEFNRRGIRIVWSNDMMWEFKGEGEAVRQGLIDRVVFVSEVQRTAFAKLYNGVKQFLIPNYVAPERFPFRERQNPAFTIGRLSRPDPVKFSMDFPVFYEELNLEDVHYRVQAWSDELRKKYAWHRFGPEWDLLPAGKVAAPDFLSSLDLFVYPLGHQFVESWGRSTVEAMLTGCVPLVPKGHNFEHMLVHGESGFICGTFLEFKAVARELYHNRALRVQIGRRAAKHARTVLCNEEDHRNMWFEALTF